MERILVIGAAGQIGSELVPYILNFHAEITLSPAMPSAA